MNKSRRTQNVRFCHTPSIITSHENLLYTVYFLLRRYKKMCIQHMKYEYYENTLRMKATRSGNKRDIREYTVWFCIHVLFYYKDVL